jgi:hypothetical protein
MENALKTSKIQLHIDISNSKLQDVPSLEIQSAPVLLKQHESGELKFKDRISIAAKQIKDIDSLLVFTKSVPKPTYLQSISERRFQIRAVQLLLGVGILSIT